MSSSWQRDRAEAALGHLQQAAGEMIAAARNALDLVEEAVSTAGAEDILDAVDHLSRSVFTWARTQDHGAPPSSSRADPGDRETQANDSGDPETGSRDRGDPGTERGSNTGTDPRSDPGSDPGSEATSNQAREPRRTRRPPPGDGPVERIPVL